MESELIGDVGTVVWRHEVKNGVIEANTFTIVRTGEIEYIQASSYQRFNVYNHEPCGLSSVTTLEFVSRGIVVKHVCDDFFKARQKVRADLARRLKQQN